MNDARTAAAAAKKPERTSEIPPNVLISSTSFTLTLAYRRLVDAFYDYFCVDVI